MSLVVERRFCGPAESGNGGYVSGLLAQRVGADAGGSAAVVTLRMPPPLEVGSIRRVPALYQLGSIRLMTTASTATTTVTPTMKRRQR